MFIITPKVDDLLSPNANENKWRPRGYEPGKEYLALKWVEDSRQNDLQLIVVNDRGEFKKERLGDWLFLRMSTDRTDRLAELLSRVPTPTVQKSNPEVPIPPSEKPVGIKKAPAKKPAPKKES